MPKPPAPRPPPGQSQPPSNPGLRSLIAAKRCWHGDPNDAARAQGFRGWHERGYLPHFDAPNVTQIVTFNLTDSFPVTRQAEWEVFLNLTDAADRRRRLEEWLDRGHGECWLQQSNLAALVEDALLAGCGQDYALQAWVIMPNHVHVVVDVWQMPLSRLIKRWKEITATAANRGLHRSGPFWQMDYWDTRIRDEPQLRRAIHYTESNPVRARLTQDVKAWPWSSARRKDEFGRLPPPPA